MHIRIVTRNSKLALWQAHHIEALLQKAGATTELLPMKTKGDKILDVTIAKIGSKGVFTEELEETLAAGDADIAVHSAKDIQSELLPGFELIAITARERVNDVLVSHNPVELTEELVIGTSSTRRIAFLNHFYPNVKTVPVRGNLQTRIRKMEEGACDALMLAYAGVHRMGYDSMIRFEFPTDLFTTPVGQGMIGIEAHSSIADEKRSFITNTLNHPEAALCITTERAFLRKLQGGCSIPSFGLAELKNEQIHLSCGLIGLDGKTLIRKSGMAFPDSAAQLGSSLAQEVLDDGGAELLKEIKSIQND